MDEPKPQFSLRAIFGLIAVVANAMLFVTTPRAAECAIAGICFAVPGAIFARLTGRDGIDAAFGAIYGFLAGAAFWLALPQID
ncbi:MAG TPA: hypothetical protein VMV10_10410 [Pirellulales bacterium]|nr:hypothetical protein [Pirellulales bacterium]